jgi:hypothetical protein
MTNPYWRGMVKDAVGCDDSTADILLNFQYQISNGIDTSEASKEELNEYWEWVYDEYLMSKKLGA